MSKRPRSFNAQPEDFDDGDDANNDDAEADLQEAFPSFFAREGEEASVAPPQPTTTTTKASRPSKSARPVARPKLTDSFSPELLDALSTYDKRDRSNASPPTRQRQFASRIARSGEKIANAPPEPPDVVDDSLMRDQVGRMTNHYRRFSEYGGSERIFPAAEGARASSSLNGKRARDDDQDDELLHEEHRRQQDWNPNDDDNEEEDDGEGGGTAFVDPDDEMASRILIGPVSSTRVPDQAASRKPLTFAEYTGATAASNQFKRVLRHVQGPEQGVAMVVRDLDDIYNTVSTTLAAPLRNQEIQRIAVERGLRIPDLPKVSKAEIQDGLCAPNPELGERDCVNGDNCAGYRMCLAVKKEHPETYAHAKPFACKEFYFGKYGQEVRQAVAAGTPISELRQGDPIMCVLCHIELVSRWYKQYDLLLRTDPPHILHAFQVSCGVPGGYPADKCLLGDETFKGIIAPFLRFVPDVNYFWEPTTGVMERDRITGAMRLTAGTGIQRWLERECLDFQ